VRPYLVRLYGGSKTWDKFAYQLTKPQNDDLGQYGSRISYCDKAIEGLETRMTAKMARLEKIKAGELEDLPGEGYWGRKEGQSCAARR